MKYPSTGWCVIKMNIILSVDFFDDYKTAHLISTQRNLS